MKYVFLDLEDTIITPVLDGWDSCELINNEKIKLFIEKESPDSINIFSFAMHNNSEKAQFEHHCKPMIEKEYGFKIHMYPTVEEIIDVCGLVRNKNSQIKYPVSFQELRRFWGKSGSFKIYIKEKFRNKFNAPEHEQNFILLDDEVENETFSLDDLLIKGKIINVDNLRN